VSLNLALLGYGKMGRLLAQMAPERGFEVRLVVDIDTNRDGAALTPENLRGVDVCMDFTEPAQVLKNVEGAARRGCNLVVGTTGWYDQLEHVRKLVEECGVGMVYASNFSIGTQLFFRLARAAAEMFSQFPMYDPYLVETHHRQKKDAPSGTALTIKKHVAPSYKEREIPVTSVRAGYFPGVHELGFDSEVDTVILRHTARGRQGFAEGALHAARWVAGKKGLFDFAQVLDTEAGH